MPRTARSSGSPSWCDGSGFPVPGFPISGGGPRSRCAAGALVAHGEGRIRGRYAYALVPASRWSRPLPAGAGRRLNVRRRRPRWPSGWWCGAWRRPWPRRALRLLLELPYQSEGFGTGDVGDRAVRALLAVDSGGLAPALGPYPVLLAEQGEEDLRLLLAEAGEGVEAAEQFLAGAGVLPQRGGVSVVLRDEELAQLLHPFGHRGRVAVDGRFRGEQGDELLRAVGGDLVGVQVVPAEALGDGQRAGERPFHWHLLVQQHADERGERTPSEQFVGLGLLGEPDGDVHEVWPPRS